MAGSRSSSFTVSGSHTYSEEGSYSITVQISDMDSNTTTATASATVADAALIASGLNLKQSKDTINGVVATFSDADPGGTLSDYTASIRWGDGTSSAATISASGGGFAVSGTHHYRRTRRRRRSTSPFATGAAARQWR